MATDKSQSAIAPIKYDPPTIGTSKDRKRLSKPVLLLIVTFLISAIIFSYTLLARTITITTNTEDPVIKITGGIKFRIADNYLITRGSHKIKITKEGYYPLEEDLLVTEKNNQTLTYNLVRLPDIYSIDTSPESGIEIVIDDEVVGTTPITGLELSEGTHKLLAHNEYFFEHNAAIEVAGGGQQKTLSIAMKPAWANISIDTSPSGAVLSNGDEELGETPIVARVIQGQRSIKLKLAGYKSAHRQLAVVANEDQDLGTITLIKADGLVNIETSPGGASISVDGQYRGTSPIELSLQPDKTYRIEAYKSGYNKNTKSIKVSSGKEENVKLSLSQSRAQLTVNVNPSDASIKISGKNYTANKPFSLSAESHKVEISKEGYQTVEKRITLKSGIPQTLDIQLKTNAQAIADMARIAAVNANGSHMIRISGGPITLGAPRRQSGRRTNEVSKKVEIKKPFFISRTEVSNEQFKKFDSSHTSGRTGNKSLDTPNQPVVKISWLEAAAYCNWLSAEENLTPVYDLSGGTLAGADLNANGYRLPTEAEWAYSARIENNTTVKFPWGDDFPPAANTANLADVTAGSLVVDMLPNYRDGVATTAAVGSFKANSKGIHDLAGNVSEWVHDYYTVAGNAGSEPSIDPSGPKSGKSHTIRGSSWRHGTMVELRASYRDNGNKGRDDLGFRIARNAP